MPFIGSFPLARSGVQLRGWAKGCLQLADMLKLKIRGLVLDDYTFCLVSLGGKCPTACGPWALVVSQLCWMEIAGLGAGD